MVNVVSVKWAQQAFAICKIKNFYWLHTIIQFKCSDGAHQKPTRTIIPNSSENKQDLQLNLIARKKYFKYLLFVG